MANSDPDLIRSAITAANMSARGFALLVLDVNEKTVYRWLKAERAMPGPVRVMCRTVIAHALAEIWFKEAVAALKRDHEKAALKAEGSTVT